MRGLVLVGCALVVGVQGRHALPPKGRLSLKDLTVDTPADCPCATADLCNPVTKTHEKEVFGFSTDYPGERWRHLDFTQVTTVAWNTNQELMCLAHAHGARLVAGSLPVNLTHLGTDQQALDDYVSQTVALVKKLHIDGVTFDYEDPLSPNSVEATYYTKIINATTVALHREVPGSQVSVCVAWSPNNIDGRYYDVVGMARAADLLYVMMYDTRSQIFEQCVAAPNAALPLADLGVRQWLDLKIDPSKLILGLPWYGYDYPCVGFNPATPAYCPIAFSPFRGVNCSDAAGAQKSYSSAMDQITTTKIATPLTWANDVSTPWYTYVDSDNVTHQVWIDTPRSLELKYELVNKYKLRGTGPYEFNYLDYDTPDHRQQAQEMWDALRVFTKAPAQ